MKWTGDIEGDKIIGEWITPDDADQDAYDDAMDDDTFVAVRTHNDISRLRWVGALEFGHTFVSGIERPNLL